MGANAATAQQSENKRLAEAEKILSEIVKIY